MCTENDTATRRPPSTRFREAMIAGVLTLACSAGAHAAQGGPAGLLDRAVAFLGNFHVVLVHFPIALLIVAAAAESISLVTRSERLHEGSKFFVWVGSLAAVVAATLGWFAADGAAVEAQVETLMLHRWIGTAAALWSLVVVGFMVVSTERGTPRSRIAYCLSLVVGAALVGAAGHLGGTLVHGADHFAW